MLEYVRTNSGLSNGAQPSLESSQKPKFDSVICYRFEDESVRRGAIWIANFVGALHTSLGVEIIALSELRVWKPSHDPLIISATLKSLTGSENLPSDGSLLRADTASEAEVRSLAFLSVLFGWEVTFFLSQGSAQVDISHDGEFFVYCSGNLLKIENILKAHCVESSYLIEPVST